MEISYMNKKHNYSISVQYLNINDIHRIYLKEPISKYKLSIK